MDDRCALVYIIVPRDEVQLRGGGDPEGVWGMGERVRGKGKEKDLDLVDDVFQDVEMEETEEV